MKGGKLMVVAPAGSYRLVKEDRRAYIALINQPKKMERCPGNIKRWLVASQVVV